MKLPISKQEAVKQWKDFEEYLVRERYSVRDPDTGNPFEHAYDDVIDRVANCFKDGDVYAALKSRKIITATPFLMNGGNDFTNRVGYYSCYPLGDVGDSTDEIFDMERNLATVFQHAGGGGIDVSKLRKKGAPVDNGQGNASGPVSFSKGFSHLSSRISQGGKRRGALMIQMDDTHPDIKEFVSFKGDDPGKYNGCNVSVNVTGDQFWENEELIDQVAEYMWKGGDPGLLFTKRSMENTPVPAEYNPIYSNPCGEYLSVKNTACNLLSVNLQACIKQMNVFGRTKHLGKDTQSQALHQMKNHQQYFFEDVMEAAKLAAIAGNEILDMGGFPPIPEIKEATLKHRPIGVGFTGLHAAMTRFDIDYRSGEAVQFARDVQACIMIGSMEGSKQYGEEHGLTIRPWREGYTDKISTSFVRAVLPVIIWDRGEAILDHVEHRGGLYNCVTTSQAPTGSTSQLLHVSSTGIEPYFSMIQKRRIRTADGGWKDFTLVPLEFYDYDEEKLDWIEQQTAHHIDPEQQIKILEAVQTFCHTGVSKTINMPASTTVEDVKAVIMRAKDSNLKGLTVFRDSSMEGVLTDGSKTHEKVTGSGAVVIDIQREMEELRQGATSKVIDATEKAYWNRLAKQGLEGIKEATKDEIDAALKGTEKKTRRFGDIPNRKGVTYKFSGPSSLYITANFGDKGDVMEVFIASTKPGSTTHAMCIALGRVVSVGLQYDNELRERLIKTLSDMSSDGLWTNAVLGRVCSIPAAVARVLNFHSRQEEDLEEGQEFPDHPGAPEYEERVGPLHDGSLVRFGPDEQAQIINQMADSSYSDCPACGKMSFRRDGGCSKCVECGYTSC